MRVSVVLVNVILVVFTAFVVATDGLPKDVAYIVFTAALLLVPIATVVAIRRAPSPGVKGDPLKVIAASLNILLLGFVCWAIVDHYPHPDEPGVLAYTVIAVLAPLLSALVLFRFASVRPKEAV